MPLGHPTNSDINNSQFLSFSREQISIYGSESDSFSIIATIFDNIDRHDFEKLKKLAADWQLPENISKYLIKIISEDYEGDIQSFGDEGRQQEFYNDLVEDHGFSQQDADLLKAFIFIKPSPFKKKAGQLTMGNAFSKTREDDENINNPGSQSCKGKRDYPSFSMKRELFFAPNLIIPRLEYPAFPWSFRFNYLKTNIIPEYSIEEMSQYLMGQCVKNELWHLHNEMKLLNEYLKMEKYEIKSLACEFLNIEYLSLKPEDIVRDNHNVDGLKEKNYLRQCLEEMHKYLICTGQLPIHSFWVSSNKMYWCNIRIANRLDFNQIIEIWNDNITKNRYTIYGENTLNNNDMIDWYNHHQKLGGESNHKNFPFDYPILVIEEKHYMKDNEMIGFVEMNNMQGEPMSFGTPNIISDKIIQINIQMRHDIINSNQQLIKSLLSECLKVIKKYRGGVAQKVRVCCLEKDRLLINLLGLLNFKCARAFPNICVVEGESCSSFDYEISL